jgi:hypothetical protein
MYKKSSNNNGQANHSARLWTLRLFLAILFLVAYKLSIAQTKGSATLYGFVQRVSGGASPDRSQEPGAGNTPAGGTNYYIYLVSGNSSRLYPSELWINGDLYGVQIKSMAKTPVTLDSPDPALNGRVLVPKTSFRVVQLVPISSNGVKKSANGASLAKTYSVVAVYKQNGRFYYTTLSELNSLESAALQ